jgi:hypothetical protein
MAALSSLLTYGNNALAPVAITAIQKREPCEIRKRTEDVDDVPAVVRAKAQERVNYLQMVIEKMRHTGKGMEESCLLIAMNYADAFPLLNKGGKGGASQLTYNNCRHWLRIIGKTKDGGYDFGNSAALCDNYQRGIRTKDKWNGDPEFWKAFWGFYMNRNRLAATTAYRLATIKTKQNNAFAVIPKIQSVTYRVSHLHPAEVALARHGEEALKNGFIAHIDRNWDNVQPGFMLVGDNRQFDVFVRVPGAKEGEWKAVRPWICAFIDARSWHVVSFTITTEDINNDLIANVLGAFIHSNENRAPLVCYVDNGKDFNAMGFSKPVEMDGHEHSTFIELGTNTLNSIAFNAKAKTVERYFRDMMMEFDKLFPSYLGSRPGDRPDTAAFFQKNPEKLLSVEQFTECFGAWLDKQQNMPKHGKIHKGKSPREIWESRTPLSESLSDARLFMAFLKPEKETRTITRGPKIEVNNNFYYSQELWPHYGKPVMVKTDRNNLSHVYAFKTDGTFICECHTKQSIEAYATDPESRKRIGEEMALQRRQLRNTYTAVNDLTGGMHVLSPLALLAAAPDVKIIRDGQRNSVKGASHKFVNYIVEGQETEMRGPENQPQEDMEPTAPAIDFKEDRDAAIDLEFQRKLDETLLKNKTAEDKDKGDFAFADFAKVEDKNKQEETSNELDKDFS